MFNKSQIKARVKLKKVSENEFKRFANPESSAPKVEPQPRAHSQPFIKNARLAILINTDLSSDGRAYPVLLFFA